MDKKIMTKHYISPLQGSSGEQKRPSSKHYMQGVVVKTKNYQKLNRSKHYISPNEIINNY